MLVSPLLVSRCPAGFGIHQDFEEGLWTLVIKTTADSEYEAPSQMMVMGARCPFTYGPLAGDAGLFNSLMYHCSMAPMSAEEHIKVVLFFVEI